MPASSREREVLLMYTFIHLYLSAPQVDLSLMSLLGHHVAHLGASCRSSWGIMSLILRGWVNTAVLAVEGWTGHPSTAQTRNNNLKPI